MFPQSNPSFAVAVLTIVFGFSTAAGGAPTASKAPGTYSDWHDVDKVTIERPFRFSDYKRVIVAPMNTRDARIPPPGENTYALAKEMQSKCDQLFYEGVRQKLAGTSVQVTQDRGVRSDGVATLLVRSKLDRLDPGSVAARMWAAGAAGSAQSTISGEIVDAQTSQVLVRFRQERRAMMRMIWQRESILLSNTVQQIGGDVAELMKAF